MNERFGARYGGAVGLLLWCAVLAGCGSATVVNDVQQMHAGKFEQGEAVVILSKPNPAAAETDGDFVDCVGRSLAKQDPDIRVIAQQQFIDDMYPYFETRTAPTNVQSLSTLAGDPAVRRRMAEMNVRYLIWLDGNTQTVDRSGSFSCAVGPGGGGCLGWAKWKDQGSYVATIWDLKDRDEAGTFNVETTGTSHLVGVIVPVPLLAGVESEACDATAQRIALSVKARSPKSIVRQ
ncbi:MAG: hypothetical protein D6782_12495 [Alphaproteobacteria bacterium]|nr:MAG: hypothetical protein D6782_12495 [Alphaproteobacteria bacterium]